jgi:hypothetical protein
LVQVHGECTAACYELVDQISFPEQAQEGVFDHEIPTEHENSITCLTRTLKKKITKKNKALITIAQIWQTHGSIPRSQRWRSAIKFASSSEGVAWCTTMQKEHQAPHEHGNELGPKSKINDVLRRGHEL